MVLRPGRELRTRTQAWHMETLSLFPGTEWSLEHSQEWLSSHVPGVALKQQQMCPRSKQKKFFLSEVVFLYINCLILLILEADSCLWAGSFTTLGLSLLLCNMGTVPTSELLWTLNEEVDVKLWAQGLAYIKCSLNTLMLTLQFVLINPSWASGDTCQHSHVLERYEAGPCSAAEETSHITKVTEKWGLNLGLDS